MDIVDQIRPGQLPSLDMSTSSDFISTFLFISLQLGYSLSTLTWSVYFSLHEKVATFNFHLSLPITTAWIMDIVDQLVPGQFTSLDMRKLLLFISTFLSLSLNLDIVYQLRPGQFISLDMRKLLLFISTFLSLSLQLG